MEVTQAPVADLIAQYQSLINGLVVLVIGVIVAFGATNIAVLITVIRQNKQQLEMAYNAIPSERVKELVTGTVVLADDAATTIKEFLTELRDVTDRVVGGKTQNLTGGQSVNKGNVDPAFVNSLPIEKAEG
jgi:predicted TIM-barrel enzyme